MKSIAYALLGNVVGTTGITAGKGMIVAGTTITRGGEKVLTTSTGFKAKYSEKSEREAEIEEAQREEREVARHNKVMAALEAAQTEERERHERMSQGPQLVPDNQLATA